jgi:NAD(P)-dependent dehydrogenase (short-subunit alcohol dehydrogenase family)
MDVKDSVVVVTGGAGGIGRALCRAVAGAGARAVVVADIDENGAESVAAELDGRGLAVRTDVTSEDDMAQLVGFTHKQFGVIDLFCSNAGMFVWGGTERESEIWDRMWRVNVLSHVFAVRAVLPSMLARGRGYLLHTASAAGLLTSLGSAPYTVTKHAVVALAEWISITYGDSGIGVSCLCPQGVWTNMIRADSENGSSSLMEQIVGADGIVEPEKVARDVLAAVHDERFLILPQPEVADYEQRRATDRERWLKGMRRAQATFFGPHSSPTITD